MTTPSNIPEGYKQDSQGRLVPVAAIKPVDQERDDLIYELVNEALNLRKMLRDFRCGANDDIEAFCDLSSEKYGAPAGGKKGNLTLTSFDGKYKIQRAISEVLAFDERLQAAKALIDQCITRWAKGASSEIRTLVQDAFQVDKAGNINTGRVLSLRRLSFDDDDWRNAMTAISDSLLVATTRSYLRFYERDDSTGAYLPINLDLANA
jgi:hypothetical protein